MAKFFKSTWFKCIATLLSLTVILGGTLAILNDVLYVSAEERTKRAIKKIYGTETNYTSVLEEEKSYKDVGQINQAYEIGTDLLVQATGYNGYKGGTITLWVRVVENQSGHYVIDKIVLENYTKQTLMSKLDGDFYSEFYVDITSAYNDGKIFVSDTKAQTNLINQITGATKSATAACNAVNAVINYVGEVK